MSGEWEAMLTARRVARPPAAFASSIARSSAGTAPEMTICSVPLTFAGTTTVCVSSEAVVQRAASCSGATRMIAEVGKQR